MKKLISLGVVTAMVASMASAAFATTTVSGKTMDDLKVYVLENGSISTTGLKETQLMVGPDTINDNRFSNYIYLEGRNTDEKTIIFGVSNTAIFGAAISKPAGQPILEGSTIKKENHGAFTNSGVDVTVGRQKVSAGFGEYNSAYGVKVEFTNTAQSDKYAAYTITLTDARGKTKPYTLVTRSLALDRDDISDADVDTVDEGYREFANGTLLKDGYAIFVATLKEMLGKGNYKFAGADGVDVLASVSKATVDEGKTAFKAYVAVDPLLDAKYNADGSGKIFKVVVPFFHLENRKINIDCENSEIIDILGQDFAEKVVDGVIKKLYVYPIDLKKYEALSQHSDYDGVINTDNVIVAKVVNSKIVFDLPKGVTDVMVSLKEIDTTSKTVTSANEINAPIIAADRGVVSDDIISAPVLRPEVVSAPILERAPVATRQGQQNTGASDVVVLAIALAAISMAAAGVVASKKF